MNKKYFVWEIKAKDAIKNKTSKLTQQFKRLRVPGLQNLPNSINNYLITNQFSILV